MSDLASTIRTTRKAQGLSQEALGALIGLHRHTIREWERDIKLPRYRALGRLEAALGMEPGELVALRPVTVTVPAAECRAHIQHLLRSGWSKWMISAASGLSEDQVHEVVARAERVTRRTEERILGLCVSDRTTVPARGRVSSARTERMVAEMLAAGWSGRWISQQIGRAANHSVRFPAQVWRSTEQRVEALHNRLWRENAVGQRRSGGGRVVTGVTLRSVCRCMRVPNPESVRRSEYRQREREERVA